MNPTYKVVIIEDDAVIARLLQYLLSNYNAIQIVGTVTNSKDGRTLITESHPDLIFLDIQLENKDNGLDLYRLLQPEINWSMQVVVFSSHLEMALEALHLTVFDFLKKPFQKNDLEFVINKFFLFKKKEIEEREKLIALFGKNILNQKIKINTVTGTELISVTKIGYFEYDNNINQQRWSIILTNQKRILLKRKTSAESIVEYSSLFTQINQRQIINTIFLDKVEGCLCFMLKPFDCNNQIFVLSRKFGKIFLQNAIRIK
jgi:two-component system LytT family response regulator